MRITGLQLTIRSIPNRRQRNFEMKCFLKTLTSHFIVLLSLITIGCQSATEISVSSPRQVKKATPSPPAPTPTPTLTGCDLPTASSTTVFADGAGTSVDPFIICNIHQLQKMGEDLDAYYELGQNIDATATASGSGIAPWTDGKGFNPIGGCGADYSCAAAGDNGPFSGSFHGNDYTIDGLYIARDMDGVGLFGLTDASAVITNVIFTNANVIVNDGTSKFTGIVVGKALSPIRNVTVGGTLTGHTNIGGIAGYSNRLIENCHSSATVSGLTGTFDGSYAGGIVGKGARILSSSNSGNVTTGGYAGGIAGFMKSNQSYYNNFRIVDSFSTGDIYTTYGGAGGIVGSAYVKAQDVGSYIKRCAASGDIKANYYFAGGIAGWADMSIIESGSTATVTANSYYSVGGLAGVFSAEKAVAPVVIENSYARGNVSALSSFNSGGLVGISRGTASVPIQIKNSFATGDIQGTVSVGGLVGKANYNEVTNSFATGAVSQTGTGDGAGVLDEITAGKSINNYWFDIGSDPSSCNVVKSGSAAPSPNECTSYPGALSDFYLSTHPVFDQGGSVPWDFTSIWETQASDFPKLRNIPSL